MLNEAVRPTRTASFDSKEIRTALDRDGYIIVRDLVPPEDVAEIREVVKTHLDSNGVPLRLGKTQPDASARIPELARVFTHTQVVELFRGFLGPESTVFTRHCDAHMNMVSGWHKDSGESVVGGYFKGDYFASPACQVFKIALYLQDSTARSGLTVVPGSHRERVVSSSGAVKVPTQAGDAVIFDVRLTHTGQLPDPADRTMLALTRIGQRIRRSSHDPSFVYGLRQAYWKAIGRGDRLSIFFTFGEANQFTYDFAEANLRRQGRQAGEGRSESSDPEGNLECLAAELSGAGVLTYGVNIGV